MMQDDTEDFSLPAEPAPGQWWPADISDEDLRRYGFYGGLMDAVDRHTAATGSPPDDDQLLAYGRNVADQHGVNLDDMLDLRPAAPADQANGIQVASAAGMGFPQLCDGGMCHGGTPGRPITPPPPSTIPGAPPADSQPLTLPHTPPAPPAVSSPPASQPQPQPSGTLPGTSADPLDIPTEWEMVKWEPKDWISHDAGKPPAPETEKWLDAIPDPNVRDAIRDHVFGSGSTDGADDKGTHVISSGGMSQATIEMNDILDRIGADRKDVKSNVADDGSPTYSYEDPATGVSISRRQYSKNGAPTLDILIPRSGKPKWYVIKKRY